MPHIIYNVLGDHSLQCSVPDVWSDQSALSLMTNSTEMRCGHLNKTKQRLSCNVLNEEDENTMVCRGGYKDRVSVSLCPDGSLNKTCFPVAGSKSLHYTCLCHSALQHQTDNDITATWSSWQYMNISLKQLYNLSSDAIAGSLIQDFETDPDLPDIVNIVTEYNLPDSVFTASSFDIAGNLTNQYSVGNNVRYSHFSRAWRKASSFTSNQNSE